MTGAASPRRLAPRPADRDCGPRGSLAGKICTEHLRDHRCAALLHRSGLGALGLSLSGPAAAIDGGAPAGRDALAQATVAIGTITKPEEALQLTRCTGVLIAPTSCSRRRTA
ncbi:hypothetical protein ACU4GR_23360 [Methylobacterium oryzae CBMB20]